MRCSGLCPRKPRGLVRAFSGALGLKHVICGCCRVTSQKRLSSRLQALSSFSLLLCLLSFEFDWMVGLVGVEARVQVKARAGREVTSAIQEMFKSHATFEREFKSESKRAICNWRVVFQQSNLPLPTGGLSNPIVRMGRSPTHVQACWVDQQFCDVSSLLGRINCIDLYTCIIMQGIKI